MNIPAEVVNACQKTKRCVMRDDADAIVYCEMFGQLKPCRIAMTLAYEARKAIR